MSELSNLNLEERPLTQKLIFRITGLFVQINFSLYRYTPLGLLKIKNYSEKEELFEFMNYVAVPSRYDEIRNLK